MLSDMLLPHSFWYDSYNDAWGACYTFDDIAEMYGRSGFYYLDDFLDNSREIDLPGSKYNFGTSPNHTGIQTLRMFLCGEKVLKEFIDSLEGLYN